MRKIIILSLIAVLIFSATGVIMNCKNTAYAQTNPIQARGVWHRPNVTNQETNLEGICSILDKFQYAGINLVFLETFYHGMTVFKTSTVEYYTGFESYDYGDYPDYLSAFVAEAQKRNIEVHAWVEDFYIGVKANRFVKNCPQWLLLNSSGSYRQTEGASYGGYIFLDPANAEVCTYLVNFYNELLTKFPQIKGLNLDYIRYPLSDTSDDTGFTKVAMDSFAQSQNWHLADDTIQTFVHQLNRTGSHAKFTDFRAGCVTNFVEQVYQMVKESHPNVLLSTAIFPEVEQSYNQKKQDFSTWLKNGYLDIVTPMAYYDDNSQLKSALTSMMKDCQSSFCYAGLSSTYHSLSNERVLQQIDVCNNVGADGFVFFGSQSILNNDGYIQLLHDRYGSVTTNDVTPHSNVVTLVQKMAMPIVEKLLQDPLENPTKIKQLQQQLQDIINLGEDSLWALNEATNNLKLLVKYNLSAFVSQSNIDQVQTQLELLYRYISIYANRANIKQTLPQYPPQQNPDEPPNDDNNNGGNNGNNITPNNPDTSVDTTPNNKNQLVVVGAIVLGALAITIALTTKRKK